MNGKKYWKCTAAVPERPTISSHGPRIFNVRRGTLGHEVKNIVEIKKQIVLVKDFNELR